MDQRADTSSSTTSEESSFSKSYQESKSEPEPQSQSQPPEPLLTTLTRFTTLYLTTLFSLDNITAARLSPHSLPPTNGIPEELRRTGQGSDYGEGEGVGFRMDPGGRPRREIGRVNGDAGNINVPACKGCKYSAAPTIG